MKNWQTFSLIEIKSTASLTVATVREKMKLVDFNVAATEKQIYDKVRRIQSPKKVSRRDKSEITEYTRNRSID